MTTSLDPRWGPDSPDFRDIVMGSPRAMDLEAYLIGLGSPQRSFDFRDEIPYRWESGRCVCAVAHACCSVLEYMRARCDGRIERLSRGFVASAARMLDRGSPEANLSIRSALRGIRRTGVPPEWLTDNMEKLGHQVDTSPLCYAFASECSALQYVRVPVQDPAQIVGRLKRLLHAHLPCVVGMSLPSTFPWTSVLELRSNFDTILDQTAVVLCGYEDCGPSGEDGVFTFFGPYSSEWGSGGFGEMRYSYLSHGLVSDIWIVYTSAWLNQLERDRTSAP